MLRDMKGEKSRVKNATQGRQIKTEKENVENSQERRKWKRIPKNQVDYLNILSKVMKIEEGGSYPLFLFPLTAQKALTSTVVVSNGSFL